MFETTILVNIRKVSNGFIITRGITSEGSMGRVAETMVAMNETDARTHASSFCSKSIDEYLKSYETAELAD